MRSPDKATEHTIRLGKQHVTEQEARIERQKKLVASLEAHGQVGLAQAARQLLTLMIDLLETMRDDVAQAKERLEDRRAH